MKPKNILKHLNELGYYFNEMDSRMNYGLIGQLQVDGKIKIVIFPECIYVHDKDLNLTNSLLSYIKRIQKDFKGLKKYDTCYGAHTKNIKQNH